MKKLFIGLVIIGLFLVSCTPSYTSPEMYCGGIITNKKDVPKSKHGYVNIKVGKTIYYNKLFDNFDYNYYDIGDTIKCTSYTQKTVDVFNKLTPPIILHGKIVHFDNSFKVTIIDSNNTIYYMSNDSELANLIGGNYNIGDTLIF